jgi:serine protease AprX
MDNMLDLIIECSDSKLPEDICTVLYRLPLINCIAVRVNANDIDRLKSSANIKAMHIMPHITAQMNNARKTINADNLPYSGRGITIAFLDTGICTSADFEGRITVFKDFVNGIDKPYDDNGHGTHVTGIACGSGKLSDGKYRGIAPDAKIAALKTLNNEGRGSAADILAGMQWVCDNKEKYNIRVVNLSIGTPAASSDDPLVRASEALWDLGITVVTAAGNNGPYPASISSPGISRKVITVGSNDDEFETDIWGTSIKNFSSRGPTKDCIVKPDILSPGHSITSCLANAKAEPYYRALSGTSMSTPMVSGAVADLLEKEPSLSPDDIKYMLKRSCVKLGYPHNREGWGLLNVYALLSQEVIHVRNK